MRIAAVVGALVIVATKCMSVQEAIKAIDWNCMLLVGSLTAISAGVKNSGAGDAVANLILRVLGDNPADQYSVEQQAEAAKLGAVIEHSYLTTYWGRTPIESLAEQIRAVGCENVLLTTDFGQVKSDYFDEGLAQYARLLLDAGFTHEELRQMMQGTPERLIG